MRIKHALNVQIRIALNVKDPTNVLTVKTDFTYSTTLVSTKSQMDTLPMPTMSARNVDSTTAKSACPQIKRTVLNVYMETSMIRNASRSALLDTMLKTRNASHAPINVLIALALQIASTVKTHSF